MYKAIKYTVCMCMCALVCVSEIWILHLVFDFRFKNI